MSVTDGQHKVPIAIQRPAPSRLLVHGDRRRSRGAGGRAPPASGPAAPAPPTESGSPRPAARPELGAGAAEPRTRSRGRVAEADTRDYTFAGSRGWRWAGGGAGSCELRTSFPLPTLSAVRVTSLYGQRKKIIKKTYKITIEKVILLGEAPLRLRGAFVHFFFFFFKCSFPSAT